MGGALVTLLLVVGACPERMPRRFSRPFDEHWSQELGALETPVDPGIFAVAFRHRRNARILLERIGRGVAVALLTKGDEKTRGKDGASTGESVKQREVRMALGTLGNGLIALLDSLQGDAEWADEGLDQEGIGSDDALIGGQGGGARDGV